MGRVLFEKLHYRKPSAMWQLFFWFNWTTINSHTMGLVLFEKLYFRKPSAKGQLLF